MASDVKHTVNGEKEVLELNDPVEVEAKLLTLSLSDSSGSSKPTNVPPLAKETVWFKQQQYENAETLYHMVLAGTTELKIAPGSPGKRHHVQDGRAQSKKQKQDQKTTGEFWNKKFKSEGASLLKTAKNIQGKLEDLEKIQQRKSQAINDAVSRIAAAVEECQTRLIGELAQSAGQMNVFRSLLSEIETITDKATSNFSEKTWGRFKTQEKYCQKMSERFSNLGKELRKSSSDLCNCFQADVSKSEINRVVGDISKIILIKKQWDNNIFAKKKDTIASNIKSLLADDSAGIYPDDSDSSLEGSCSVSSDGMENNGDVTEKQVKKPRSGRASKSKNTVQINKQAGNKINRNNANIAQPGRSKVKAASAPGRPNLGQNVGPFKRNAQGIQSAVDKRSDLFQFKGISSPLNVPFGSQPGLLGHRPNVLHLQGPNLQTQFGFSQFVTAGQKQQAISNFRANHNPLSAVNQSGFGNMNFNFSGSQARGSLDYAQNTMNQARNNQMKQARLYQNQQGDQTKGNRRSDNPFGVKPGLNYQLQQKTSGPGFLQNPQTGILGNHPRQGDGRSSFEQQLNEMAQKIQQMQHAASHNIQLQHLMRETERLKQLVNQKQHHSQQQDRFQQQFQVLINSFMQQQRQQQFQAPQSKMARAVPFQNPQKQQQHIRHQQMQQQKKRKQQKSKVHQVKPEPQTQSSQPNNEIEKAQQESKPVPQHETVLQNGEGSFTLEVSTEIISKNSKVTKIGTFSPQAQGDKHKAGVSSLVVMEHISCVVVVDIINSCLKLYNITVSDSTPPMLSHHLVTRLELSRPYYMGKLNKDMIVVSREGKLLSLVRVSKKRLEFLHDIRTESQYYGLGYVRDNVIVCAAFTDNRIDLLSIQDGSAQTATLFTQCKGPELVVAVPSTGSILYLERVLNETVHLRGISQQSVVEFSTDLESSPKDVWSVASIFDKLVCCNKQSGQVKLFSKDGVFLADIIFPPGTVNQPFATTFCDAGHMYIANDGAWDGEYDHYITTDINVYSFS